VVATAPKGGSGDAETEADNVQKAHAAAALYLALMQLPGARSHVFNEFTFRSVVQSIRCIVVAPPSRGDKEKGKKRKARAAAGAGLSRAQRAEKREGTRKSARVGGSSAASRQQADEDEDEDEDEDDMKLCQSDDEDADDVSGSPRGSGTHDQSDEEQRSLGMQLLCQARQLAANLSLQTCPQAHDQLARVSVETALSLPSSTPEAGFAWDTARALTRPLHGQGAGKTVLKHLLPSVLRPGAPAAAVKGVVAFVDSCLAELPPPSAQVPEAQQGTDHAASSSKAPVGGEAVADAAAGDGEAVSAEAPKQGQAPTEDKLEDAVVVLCHQLCVRVGDRAPTRVLVATAVTGLLDALRKRRGAEQAKVYLENMGRFISRLARHAKPALRLFACELAGVMLFRQEQDAEGALPAPDAEQMDANVSASAEEGGSAGAEETPEGMRLRLLRTLFKRCSDKLPSVRAKALSSIATALQHQDTARQVVLGLGAAAWAATNDATANMSLTVNKTALNTSALNTSALNTSLNASARTEGADANVSAEGVSMLVEDAQDIAADLEGVWEVVRRRCEDPKSFVRKGAVQVLEARLHVLLHSSTPGMPPLDSRDVSAVLKRCQDASVLVRKQALEAVSALVSHSLGADGTTLATVAQRGGWDVVVGWVKTALPMVRDREPAVADRALEGVFNIVLQPMADGSKGGKELPEMVRAIMSLMGDDSRAYLQFACRSLGKKKPSGLPQGLTKRCAHALLVSVCVCVCAYALRPPRVHRSGDACSSCLPPPRAHVRSRVCACLRTHAFAHSRTLALTYTKAHGEASGRNGWRSGSSSGQ